MALSDVNRVIGTEEETPIVLGPITAANSRRSRFRFSLSATGGIPGADAFQLSMAASVSTSDTASLANLDAGTSVISKTYAISNVEGEHVYDGSSTPRHIPYCASGKTLEYSVPIPEFTGADRYLVIFVYLFDNTGELTKTMSFYVEEADQYHAEAVPRAVGCEASWVLPATTSGFVNIGPFAYSKSGGRLRVDAGSDASLGIGNLSVALVDSDTRDQTTFDAGRLIASARPFSVPFGSLVPYTFDIPASEDGGDRWCLIKIDIPDETTAAAHSNFMFTVEGPTTATLRSRVTRERLPR